jgi:hypothetical protein
MAVVRPPATPLPGAGGGLWQTVTTNVDQFAVTLPGDGQVRWRVTAIGADGVCGTPSAFRTFSWSLTAIDAFNGLWVRAGGSGPTQARVTRLSSSTARLEMEFCNTRCVWNAIGTMRYTNDHLFYQSPDEAPSYRLTLTAGGGLRIDQIPPRHGRHHRLEHGAVTAGQLGGAVPVTMKTTWWPALTAWSAYRS